MNVVAVDPEGAEADALHALASFDGARVLEIGCGDGRLTWRYADLAAYVLALDVDEHKIAAARTETPEHLRSVVRFEVADITRAPVGEAGFDIAVLAHSL